MKNYVPRLYTPAELKAAIEVLQNNPLHHFHEGDATAIVKALHERGFRIVKITEPL